MNTKGWVENNNPTVDEMVDKMNRDNNTLYARIIKEFGTETLYQKFNSFKDHAKEKIDEIHKPKGNFNCIIHNDPWCNNFLFK